MSGKLGTRRAAVQYGIPRSTLRNKVYKLAMEQKREEALAAAIPPPIHTPQIIDDDGGDSGPDENDREAMMQQLSSNQVYANAMKNYLKMYDASAAASTSNDTAAKLHEMHSNKLAATVSTPTPPPSQQPPASSSAAASHLSSLQTQQTHQPPSGLPNSYFDPSLLQLQSLLMGGGPGLAALPALFGQQQQQLQQQQQQQQSSSSKSKQQQQQQHPQLDETAALPELIRKFLQHQQELMNEQLKTNTEHLNNGQQQQQQHQQQQLQHQHQQLQNDPRYLMHTFMQQQQREQQHHLLQNKLRKSGTPDTSMTATTTTPSSLSTTNDLNDGNDNSAVILKIPSLKNSGGSVSGGSLSSPSLTANLNNSGLGLGLTNASSPLLKNGLDNLTSPSPPRLARPLLSDSPLSVNHHMSTTSSVTSPVSSLMRQRSESQSPPLSLTSSKDMLTMNDVIAKSISRNFQQHSDGNLKHSQLLDHMEQYKRPNISVIKNIGGTDISRFGSNPNITMNHHHSMLQHGRDRHRESDRDRDRDLSNTGTGGKGTRPKRGKYRNYDRDSLVEAVKAVQRGEMSVHRAGSYYGVPHSTLEYKVKERHLMRPRKREPKPQLDTATSPSSSNISAATQKAQDVIGSGTLRALEKNKAAGLPQINKQHQHQSMKTPPPTAFSANSPNGIKMFDPTIAAYTSQLLWSHHPSFAGLPMDFPRQAGVPGGTTAEQYFAAQMMQKFQEETTRNMNSSSASSTKSMNNSNGGGVNNISSSSAANTSKTTRDLAESLYESANTNGSFFEGIIRQSLDKKSNDVLGVHSGALFEQLIKTSNSINRSNSIDENNYSMHNNNNINNNNNNNSSNNNNKRSASPLNFAQQNIKMERRTSSSSASSSSGDSSGGRDVRGDNGSRRNIDEDADDVHSSVLNNKLYDNFNLNNTNMENLFKLQQFKAAAAAAAGGGGASEAVANAIKSSRSSSGSSASSASITPPTTASLLSAVAQLPLSLAQLPITKEELNNGTSTNQNEEDEDSS